MKVNLEDMSQYPQCNRMLEVREDSQKLGEFLIWIKGRYTICNYEGHSPPHPIYTPVSIDIEQELATYFGIDLRVLEQEKRQMQNELRV